jgi:hypothetical protein
MAETMLSDRELAAIAHDLDELVMPDYETIRRVVAEYQHARTENANYAAYLLKIGQLVEHAQRGDSP